MKLFWVDEKWTFSGPYPRSKTRELSVRVCDDGWFKRRPVEGDARNERAAVRLSWNTKVDVPALRASWEEGVDSLPVDIPFSPHLIHIEEEGGVDSIRHSGERSV